MLPSIGTSSPFLRGGTQKKEPVQWSFTNQSLLLNQELITLRGINWKGFETDILAVDGLYSHSIEFFLDQIRIYDFNTVRVPFSVQWVLQYTNTTPHPRLISNDIECFNKTSLAILDLFFEKALRKNLAVVLNLGRLNKDFKSDLWFNHEYTVDDFYRAWYTILDRYQNYKNILGIDVYNEPCASTYGTNLSTDWHSLVEQFINRTEQRYPGKKWLYLVQGIECGNVFKNFSTAPLHTSVDRNRIVFTPRIFDKDYFFNPGQRRLSVASIYSEWDREWGFMAPNHPLLITNALSKSNIWYFLLMNYLKEKQISNIILWNIDDDIHLGMFYDDWKTIDANKIQLLNQIQNRTTKFFFQKYQ